MADKTDIEWTDATWNPVTGCSVVSSGCTNCYAMKLAGMRLRHHPSRAGLTTDSKAGPVWNGKVRLNEDWLDQPLRWSRPRRIFVCAHGDLFHEAVPDAWIDRVFAVMALARQHIFQVLTKRPERVQAYLQLIDAQFHGNPERLGERFGGHCVELCADPCAAGWFEDHVNFPLPNVWIGVSIEDQATADARVPILLDTPAAVRFVSAEPLLGPVDLTEIEPTGDGSINALTPVRWESLIEDWRGASEDWEEEFLDWYGLSVMPANGPAHKALDWVICGGESGPGARPMHPGWARSLRDQCAAAGVPFFFKQWGEWIGGGPGHCRWSDVRALKDWGDDRFSGLIGKRRAGRRLDGIEYSAFPAQEPR